MADKTTLNVFRKTAPTEPAPGADPQPTGADVIDLAALIDALDLAPALDRGKITQSGVGLRLGEIEALDTIGAELGGVARNALLRTGARLVIALYRAGRLDLGSNLTADPAPPPRRRYKQPGSTK